MQWEWELARPHSMNTRDQGERARRWVGTNEAIKWEQQDQHEWEWVHAKQDQASMSYEAGTSRCGGNTNQEASKMWNTRGWPMWGQQQEQQWHRWPGQWGCSYTHEHKERVGKCDQRWAGGPNVNKWGWVGVNTKLGEWEGECENANEGEQWWMVGEQWQEQEWQQQRC